MRRFSRGFASPTRVLEDIRLSVFLFSVLRFTPLLISSRPYALQKKHSFKNVTLFGFVPDTQCSPPIHTPIRHTSPSPSPPYPTPLTTLSHFPTTPYLPLTSSYSPTSPSLPSRSPPKLTLGRENVHHRRPYPRLPRNEGANYRPLPGFVCRENKRLRACQPDPVYLRPASSYPISYPSFQPERQSRRYTCIRLPVHPSVNLPVSI